MPYWLVYADDTGMFYGMKFYNDLLMEAGPLGNVQSEVLLQKDKDTFTFKQGWAFPRKVYFNGDECMLPPPDTYPFLPNSAYANPIAIPAVAAFLLLLLSMWWSHFYGRYKCFHEIFEIDKARWLWGLAITDSRYIHCQF